jgi:ABC-type uncharacterized transport system permease subunit
MISALLLILLGVWILKAMVDVGIGILEIVVGSAAIVIGAAIYMTIRLVDSFVWLWRTAFPR